MGTTLAILRVSGIIPVLKVKLKICTRGWAIKLATFLTISGLISSWPELESDLRLLHIETISAQSVGERKNEFWGEAALCKKWRKLVSVDGISRASLGPTLTKYELKLSAMVLGSVMYEEPILKRGEIKDFLWRPQDIITV